MAGTVSFTGMSSGQNMNEVIDALVSARRTGHIAPLERWQATWESKIELIDVIDSTMAAFYNQVKTMDRFGEFMVRTASSGNAAVAGATASSSALPGAYGVTVGSDVKHRLGSEGKADADTTVCAGAGSELTVTVGDGSPVTVLFGLDMTLEEMADTINASGAAVTAEVINDGSAANPYRLVLTADTGGSANTVTVTGNTTAVDFAMSGAGDRIDDVETVTWSGTAAAAAGGQYLGTTNKTLQFTVASEGGAQVVGADTITLQWRDGEGNSGEVTLNDTYVPGTPVDVYQGVQVSLGAGDVAAGDTFSVDLWHPDLQQGQDDGLARAEKQVHTGFADTDTTAVTATDQSFSYTYNGQTRTVTVGAGTTLSELAAIINADTENPGVTATVLDDGSGLNTAFHLVLNGRDTGAAYQISAVSHTLDNFDAAFNQTQGAQNAMFKVDNYPAGDQYLQNATNTVSGAIDGVRLTLAGSGTTTVSVGTDTEAIVSAVETFTQTFNDVRYVIQGATKFGGEEESNGLLLGNYALQIVKTRLDALVTGTPAGFQDPPDTYVNLQQLGFFTDTEEGSETQGLLLLDTEVLRSALTDDPDAVASLFAAHFDGATSSSQIRFTSSLDTATPGVYAVEVDTGSEQGRFQLEGGAWSDWYDLDGSSGDYTLTGTSGPERGIALTVSLTAGSGSYTTELSLKNGVATEMGRELMNLLGSSGPLMTLVDNYAGIIANIEKRIEQEESRLETYETRLIDSFARLDAYVARMNNQSSLLSQMSSTSAASSTG